MWNDKKKIALFVEMEGGGVFLSPPRFSDDPTSVIGTIVLSVTQ